ncbi:MAG: PAS domain S-box protein [Pseudomonadota bacterium]
MSQNETLREALLEIEVLRRRERETLRETEALLEILRITTEGGRPIRALGLALEKTAEVLGAEHVIIGRIKPDGLTIESATARAMVGATINVDPDFLTKPRNVLDATKTTRLESWCKTCPTSANSLLFAPLNVAGTDQRALVCLHSEPRRFTKKNLSLLQRIIQLTAQALRTLELSSQNALLAAVIDGSSSGFAIADATREDLPLVFVNEAFETLTGYSREEAVGQNCRFLSAEPRDSPERIRLRQAVKDRTEGRFLLRNIKKDGTPFWNELSLFPVYDSNGTLSQLVATQTDATERVLAEEDTKTARARLRDVLDHTNDAYLMVQSDGTVAFANDGTKDMFKAPKSKWRPGTSFSENWREYIAGMPASFGALPDELADPDLDALCRQPLGIRSNLADGRQVLFRAQRTDENSIVVSATETTAIRNTERLLRQRAAAVENAQNGIAILDEDGRITYANGALGGLLGYGSEPETLGRKWRMHYSVPERADQLSAEFGLSENSEILKRKTSEGRSIYHEVTRTCVEKVGDVLVLRDVSSAIRNRNRLIELNNQMEEARRHEAISTLASGLAHDFNNVLSAIAGSATLITTDPNANDEVRSHAERISKAGGMAARLVNRMLDLGSTDDDASVFDLRAALGEVRALAEVNLSPQTSFEVTAGEEALSIRAAISEIALVILNLVINANDALQGAPGQIELTVGIHASSDKTPLAGKLLTDLTYANITVRDTGEGIPEEHIPKIMQSFFTTKGHQGTGAGLAMVGAIVKRLGGAIFVESTLGEGTTVEVALPLFETSSSEQEHGFARPDLSGKAIIVLDDQLDVAKVTAAFLTSCGAEVSVLDDPELAVETVLEDPGDWDALISDYDMPGMSGGDVVETINKQVDDFPIFIVTALARRLSDTRINKTSVQGVFAKPVNLGHLATAISKNESSK